ncbi:rod-binding protein [Planctomicrobium sp. SH661]|uniref:rod-binding protein n=1 Tax=Planctomicrobium sp. SH661 TaxID=3448124 RepID=UPI003F5B9322
MHLESRTVMNAIGPATLPTAHINPSLNTDHLSDLHGRKPEDLAQQFEGIFISMLVKEMRQSAAGEEGMFPGDGSDTYGGIFDMYMGQHIAEQGGLGMSAQIAAAIQKQSGSHGI